MANNSIEICKIISLLLTSSDVSSQFSCHPNYSKMKIALRMEVHYICRKMFKTQIY